MGKTYRGDNRKKRAKRDANLRRARRKREAERSGK